MSPDDPSRARSGARVATALFGDGGISRTRSEEISHRGGTGDRKAVMALLTEDVEYMADGGSKVKAA